MKEWTQEELDQLHDLWGIYSFPRLVKALGRTPDAIKCKALELGLGSYVDAMDGYTLRKFAEIIGVHHNTVRNWITRHGLPAPMKLSGKSRRVYCIRPEDFWKWVKEHPELANLSAMEDYGLGPEPDWIWQKREKDRMERGKVEKRPWTVDEIRKFHELEEKGLSAAQIGMKLGRTRKAIIARRRKEQGYA